MFTSFFKKTLLSAASATFIMNAAAAQSIDLNSSSRAIDGISNIASSIISDSFVPMTHYKGGDINISAVPAYFRVDRAYDSPGVSGDDLSGYAAGLGAGYAHSSRLMFYGIAGFMRITGGLESAFYTGLTDESFKMDTEYSVFSLNAGAGYDLVESGSFSIPVYLGLSFQYYSGSGKLPSYSAFNSTASLSIESSGLLAGISAGIAPSYKLMDTFVFTPYFLYTFSFNSAESEARTELRGTISQRDEHSLGTSPFRKGMIGFAFTWKSSRSLSFSVSAGGWIRDAGSWYNDEFLNGLEMKSAVVAVSYSVR